MPQKALAARPGRRLKSSEVTPRAPDFRANLTALPKLGCTIQATESGNSSLLRTTTVILCVSQRQDSECLENLIYSFALVYWRHRRKHFCTRQCMSRHPEIIIYPTHPALHPWYYSKFSLNCALTCQLFIIQVCLELFNTSEFLQFNFSSTKIPPLLTVLAVKRPFNSPLQIQLELRSSPSDCTIFDASHSHIQCTSLSCPGSI
ncbi:hypothetical protein C8J57DRAFT_1249593 [Mycena rebaudengoi]|nr:hypothetical protein C8J57DRAFT_1249593 [Mycena rebaudengoi]